MNLKEWFPDLHRKSAEKLSEKLARGVASYVEAQPANTLLPPERELAAELGVNRRTLCKAMEPLVREGLLERTRRGTVVRKEHEASVLDFKDIHPFVFGHIPKQKLKVLLFENLAEQKSFWHETADAFGEDVELEWLPLECRTPAALADYIQKSGCDLAQVNSQNLFSSPELLSLFSRLPDEILAFHEDPRYRLGHFFSEHPSPGDILFPVYFQFLVLWLNRERTDACGFDISRFERGEFPLRDLIRAVVRKRMEPETFLAPHFAVLSYSVREERPVEITSKNLEKFYRNFYEILADAAPKGNRLFVESAFAPYEFCTPENLQFFRDGKLLLMPHFSVLANPLAKSVQIPFVQALVRPAARNVRTFYPGLAVVRNSGKAKIAAEFLLHLLSEPVQRKIASKLNVAPFLIAADKELDLQENSSSQGITEQLNRVVNNIPDPDLNRWELNRPEVDALLNGYMSVEDAVNSTVDKIMEYQTRKQSEEK